ncbi:MAG TPA: hypothetical protein VKA68_14600 [bacterium]|nr:hypothetical protein [bacterium]
MNPKVFHIRLPRFPVQAERVVDPRLATRSVGIISSEKSSGTLVAVSPEAEEDGLQPGMPASLVRKMSPRTVLLPANAALYHKVNQVIYEVVSSFCPVVEPGGFGQFYLDMHGMERVYQSYRQAGDRVMQSIQEKADLGSQVGISRNKLVSAITTRVVPERLYSVESGQEVGFLSPLYSGHLPITTEQVVQAAIRDLNARVVRDVQNLTLNDYSAEVVFGRYSRQVHHQAYGIDTSAVKPPQIRDHIVERQVLEADTNDEDILRGTVRLLGEQIAFQLREQQRVAKKAVFSVHYTDGCESTATGSLPHYSDRAVTGELERLYERANIRRNRVRSVMADVSEFRAFARQMDLFDDAAPPREDALSDQLDRLRRKYGFEAVQPATALLQAA